MFAMGHALPRGSTTCVARVVSWRSIVGFMSAAVSWLLRYFGVLSTGYNDTHTHTHAHPHTHTNRHMQDICDFQSCLYHLVHPGILEEDVSHLSSFAQLSHIHTRSTHAQTHTRHLFCLRRLSRPVHPSMLKEDVSDLSLFAQLGHIHTHTRSTHTHTLMVQMKPHHTHRRRHLFVVFVSLTCLCHGKRGSLSRASFLCCGLAAAAMPKFTGAVEARPGRAAVPERAAWYRYLQRQGHVLTDAEQEELRAREAVLCAPAGAERLAAQPALQQQLDRFLALLERRFEEFAALRKPSLKAILDVHAAGSDAEIKFGKHFMSRCFPKLSQEQKDVLLEWEAMLCEPADAERLAAQPALQRQLDRLVAVLERRFEEFAALR